MLRNAGCAGLVIHSDDMMYTVHPSSPLLPFGAYILSYLSLPFSFSSNCCITSTLCPSDFRFLSFLLPLFPFLSVSATNNCSFRWVSSPLLLVLIRLTCQSPAASPFLFLQHTQCRDRERCSYNFLPPFL